MIGQRTSLALLLCGLMACRHGRSSDDVHVVAPGETLSEIADHYGVPLEKLVKSNRLADPDTSTSTRSS